MRPTILLLVVVSGWLACGTAGAQTDAIPARLSLAEAVRIAEQRNPTLDVARQQALVADAETAAAKRWPNPLASVESAGYSGKSTPYGFWDRQELTIQVEQEFELADRRRLRGEAAGAAAAAARAVARQSRRASCASRSSASTSSWCWRGSTRSRPARRSPRSTRSSPSVGPGTQQGEVSGGELRRLEVERLKFSEDALQAELATRNSRSALLALLGAPRLDQPLEPTDALAAPGGRTGRRRGASPARPGAPRAPPR